MKNEMVNWGEKKESELLGSLALKADCQACAPIGVKHVQGHNARFRLVFNPIIDIYGRLWLIYLEYVVFSVL